jgi:hypothetical protein
LCLLSLYCHELSPINSLVDIIARQVLRLRHPLLHFALLFSQHYLRPSTNATMSDRYCLHLLRPQSSHSSPRCTLRHPRCNPPFHFNLTRCHPRLDRHEVDSRRSLKMGWVRPRAQSLRRARTSAKRGMVLNLVSARPSLPRSLGNGSTGDPT